ncbi:hypothetical protein KEM56_006802 [Ascosphaera pollenicola]|nr:hypothetical protein KEM56_006802 [Ascosphaera pollenicola]
MSNTPNYSLLDLASEDTFHTKRLLNVEEKPFKRITRRILNSNLIAAPPSEIAHPEDRKEREKQWRELYDEVALDFAAFHGSLARIQSLFESNEQERKRYGEEKLRIEQTAQAVRDNSADLRTQLVEAQNSLALRKQYDELAEKITSNRLLKPRDQQKVKLEELNAEIAKLEQEREEYAKTWIERREQFGRIVEEGMQLRRLIRDEKKEVERREGMQNAEDHEEFDAASTRGSIAPSKDGLKRSGSALPSGGETERPTPLQQSTAASPAPPSKAAPHADADEDENMVDEGEIMSDEDKMDTT